MSSTQRRTAFARVPRFPDTVMPPASQRININKDYIDALAQARLSPDLSTVLTRTASTLNIEIQANGRGTINVQKNGVVVADSPDIQRISMLGSFINNERKAVLKETVAGKALRFIASLVENSGPGKRIPQKITKIDDSFLDVYRVVRAQLETLTDNVKRIEAVGADGKANNMVRDHLLDSARRIINAATYFLVHRAPAKKSSEENRKINFYLKSAGVLNWVFTRLTSQKLQLGAKDFEYRRLYFPRDPTKGIYLHFEELMNERVRESQLGLLDTMKPFQGLLTPKFVSEFCAVPKDWDLSNFSEQSSSRVLKNIPILIVPSLDAYTSEEIFQTMIKSGDKGLAWNSGAGSSVQDMLKFLGTMPKRIAFGILTRPYAKIGLIKQMFPNLNIDDSNLEMRGVYLQLGRAGIAGDINTDYFSVSRGILPNTEVFRMVTRTCLEINDAQLLQLVNEALSRNDQLFQPGNGPRESGVLMHVETTSKLLTDEDARRILSGVMFLPKGKKLLRDPDGIRLARSALTAQSSSLLKLMKSKGYYALSVRVERYLRSFMTDVVQSAVSEAIAAKLDASLAHPVLYDREDFNNILDEDIYENDQQADIEMEEANPPLDNPDEL